MHMGALAFWSPLALSVACFVAGGIWLMLWTRSRTAYMLLSVLTWWALCGYFALLTVSAGAVPVVTRGDIAGAVRQWGFVVAGLIMLAKGALLVVWRRSGRTVRGVGAAAPTGD